MTLIDGDRIITAQLYDDEYEEWTEEKMSIIDYINAYTDEGVTTADDVLDKIIAEIGNINLNEVASKYEDRFYGFQQEVIKIIDKYKGESENKE